MKNDGKGYERFVGNLSQAIIDSEEYLKYKNVKIELNKIIEDNCGVNREFDIYWEYELCGIVYKTVIECKDYKDSVSVDKIDSLLGKIKDLPDLKPVFATKKGYQSGAEKKAKHNKIDLLIVREQNESDWTDEFGNPFIKIICINMLISSSAYIIEFVPNIDGNWVRDNTDIDITKPLRLMEQEDNVIIEDIEKNRTMSLYEIKSKLKPFGDKEYGEFEVEEKFSDAFINYGDLKLKLISYKLKYQISKPMEIPIKIDYTKELIGVIEYLGIGMKKAIFKNGKILEEKIKR